MLDNTTMVQEKAALTRLLIQNGSLSTGTAWERTYRVKNDDEIIAFAKALKTRNRVHLEPEVARHLGYRSVIAPGVMISGFIEETVTDHAPCVVLRELSLKFKNALYAPAWVLVQCSVSGHDRVAKIIDVKVRDENDVLAYGECRLWIPRR